MNVPTSILETHTEAYKKQTETIKHTIIQKKEIIKHKISTKRIK